VENFAILISMQNILSKNALYATSLGIGFLGVLGVFSFLHLFIERGFSGVLLLQTVTMLVLGISVGVIFARHISLCDHEHLDSPQDFGFLISVVAVSLLHTMIDGSVFHEAIDVSLVVGLITLSVILFHEVFRTGILFSILRGMRFSPVLSGFAVFGVSLAGIVLGIFLSRQIHGQGEVFEGMVHLFSGALYALVATDVYYFLKRHYGRVAPYALTIGIVLGVVVEYLHKG
jgi:hypothetical protein